MLTKKKIHTKQNIKKKCLKFSFSRSIQNNKLAFKYLPRRDFYISSFNLTGGILQLLVPFFTIPSDQSLF